MKNLRLEGITKVYDPGKSYQVDALRGIDAEFESGRSYAIMGASGSGKSTLLNILGCLDRPTGGSYLWDGRRIDALPAKVLTEMRAKDIGFILQDYGLIDSISVLENCLAPCIFSGQKRRQAKKSAADALEWLGISDLGAREVGKLSGGQKQRVAIAGVMAMRPQCIVLDEPTAMLDPNGRKEVLEAVHQLNRQENVTVVLITHYMEEVIDADRVVVMDDGHVVMEGTPKEIFSQVETLKKYRLDVPQVTLLAHELKQSGVDIPDGILTTEELVNALCQ